jgi:hypothetical protein
VLAARSAAGVRFRCDRAASLPPTKGYFVNRLWSRVGVRSASVGLLVLGVIGGVYLGQDRAVQQRSAEAQLVVQSDNSDMQLLKQREGEHAAARAWRSQAEGDAAAKAATEANAAAAKARDLEKKAIAKKAADDKAAKDKKDNPPSTPPSKPYDGPIPASCKDFTGNRAIGCSLMLDAGFGIDQFPCMDKLFKRESGWNQLASNTGSGAYGIPQALPGSKMAKFGADWKTNPVPQIKWGLDYIVGRYKTPCGAWSHSESSGWY